MKPDLAQWLQEYGDELGDLSNTRLYEEWQRDDQRNLWAAAEEIRALRRKITTIHRVIKVLDTDHG